MIVYGMYEASSQQFYTVSMYKDGQWISVRPYLSMGSEYLLETSENEPLETVNSYLLGSLTEGWVPCLKAPEKYSTYMVTNESGSNLNVVDYNDAAGAIFMTQN